jgi:hypothetical protein
MPPIAEIFPYVVSAGGAYAWFVANKLRQAGLRKANIEVESSWQMFYKGLVSDMKTEIGEMKQEIFMLRQIVESYKASCDGCPNKKSQV